MINNIKILIAEDDENSAQYLKEILQNNGFKVVGIFDTGLEVIRQYSLLKPDLVLMDIMLKDSISGCDAALSIKHAYKDAKIIFLTAYATDEMIELAVRSEAYGYIMKPYFEEEILANIKLSLSHNKDNEPKLCKKIVQLHNGFIYNTQSKRILKENREVSFSKKALKLIEILIKNKNSSVSNEEICLYVWGENKNDCTLRSLIYRIRSILGNKAIKNINGLGYEILEDTKK